MRIHTIVVGIACLLACWFSASTARGQNSQALFEKAFELFKAEDFETAKTLLEMGLRRDPSSALGHYYFAEVLVRLKETPALILRHYKLAVRLSPESKEGLDALAKAVRLERTMSEYERCYAYITVANEIAVNNCTAAIESKKYTGHELAQIYFNRGVAYQQMGNFDQAIIGYVDAARVEPGYYYPWEGLCDAYVKKKEYEKAIESCTRAISISGKNGNVYYYRGFAYSRLGSRDAAIADYGKTIELNSPAAYLAYNSRAWINHLAGRDAAALPDAEKAIELNSRHAESWDTRGAIYEKLGQRENAISDFKKALLLKPDLKASIEALKRLGAAP